MAMTGTYLVVRKNRKEIPVVLPSNQSVKAAAKIVGIAPEDVISGGSFTFNPGLRLGGFAFSCESADDDPDYKTRINSRRDEDACLLRDLFEQH